MTPKQRVILTQLQLTGLGIIFLGFGIAWKETWLIIFGVILGLYGLARLFVLKKLMDQSEQQDPQGQDQTQATTKQTDDQDNKEEYERDEWESKLESYLEKRYDNKHIHFDDHQNETKSNLNKTNQ